MESERDNEGEIEKEIEEERWFTIEEKRLPSAYDILYSD